MTKRNKPAAHEYLKHNPKAGDRQPFLSGVITYLAPLPLPTQQAPIDYEEVVGSLNDTYLMYGSGRATLFSWQMILGGPLTLFALFVLILPLIAGGGTLLLGGTWFDAKDFFYNTYTGFVGVATFSCIIIFLICILTWYFSRIKEQGLVAPRFNRQRREVCFVPEGGIKAYIVPWESLAVWTTEAQGVTQYGVQRQYAMGIGFHDETSGSDCLLEYPTSAIPLAISTWEAIRAYMEYEVHSLEDIHCEKELRNPGDPPYEGLHTFRNARRRLHRRYREGEVGLWMVFGWYLYHIMTLWSLPAFLAQREALWLQRRPKTSIPKKRAQWSEPLPKEQWAKPSELLKRQSAAAKRIWAKQPNASMAAVFAAARREVGDE